MNTFQKTAKPISILGTVLLLLMSTLNQPAAAAMVGTEKLLISDRNQETRSYLQQMMSRKDIQEALVARGIDLQEAQIRIESLTDGEIELIVENSRDVTELEIIKQDLEDAQELVKRYKEEIQELRKSQVKSRGVIAHSKEMKGIFELAHHVAKSDSTILVYGASGTGKVANTHGNLLKIRVVKPGKIRPAGPIRTWFRRGPVGRPSSLTGTSRRQADACFGLAGADPTGHPYWPSTSPKRHALVQTGERNEDPFGRSAGVRLVTKETPCG